METGMLVGLRGTGSYDYTVPEQDIPWSFTMERTCIEPQRGGALFTAGIAGYGCLGHAAVALGLMKRSLQEIVQARRQQEAPGLFDRRRRASDLPARIQP